MNLNHKPGFSFRILLALLLFFIAGSFISIKSPVTYADDEKSTEKMCPCPDIKDLEVIVIDNKGYKKDRKGPCKFTHVKHAKDFKISCWECHHDFNKDSNNAWIVPKPQAILEAQGTEEIKDTEADKKALEAQEAQENLNIWSPWGKTKKCSECHDPNEKKDGAIRLQAAYHKNCKGCHIERRIYGNDYLAYRKCTKCHE